MIQSPDPSFPTFALPLRHATYNLGSLPSIRYQPSQAGEGAVWLTARIQIDSSSSTEYRRGIYLAGSAKSVEVPQILRAGGPVTGTSTAAGFTPKYTRGYEVVSSIAQVDDKGYIKEDGWMDCAPCLRTLPPLQRASSVFETSDSYNNHAPL